MPYYPQPPAEIKNLPKSERHRIAQAAWRRVIRHPVLLSLLGLNSLAFVIMYLQAMPGTIAATVGYLPLPLWFWDYGVPSARVLSGFRAATRSAPSAAAFLEGIAEG